MSERKPRLIENLWDCPYCGTIGIKGRFRECPYCASPRQGGTKFYHNEINYVDEETEATINRNPDWCCSFCGALNSDNDHNCKSCGATRESSSKNYFDKLKEQEEKEREQQEIERAYMPNQAHYDLDNRYANRSSDTQNNDFSNNTQYVNYTNYENQNKVINNKKSFLSNSHFKAIFSGIGIVAIVFLLIFGLIKLFTPKLQEVDVTSLYWERSIEIEEYKTIREDDWSIPIGGREISHEQRIKTYNHVVDHYETKTRQVSHQEIVGYEEYVSGYRDLGNGYSEEIISQRPIYETVYETETYQDPIYVDVPVYDTYYYYDIDKWVHERYEKTNGTNNEPYWAEFTLLSKEREGTKSETYYVNGINKKDNKNVKYKLPYKYWKDIEIGQTLKVYVSVNTITSIVNDKGEKIDIN